MIVKCVWEHNAGDTLLYAVEFPGAYTRGESLDVAVAKMPQEIAEYGKWLGIDLTDKVEIFIDGEKVSDLTICDADSDIIFESEKEQLTLAEYEKLKSMALKSAEDFLTLYRSIPDKDRFCASPRKTFYGDVPRTASEMYNHTKNVNAYYFGEIDVDTDNEGDIYECRKKGFGALESKTEFLKNTVVSGSYGEDWNVRKVLRRFIWHDRIHAKAMYRMAVKIFGKEHIANPYLFSL